MSARVAAVAVAVLVAATACGGPPPSLGPGPARPPASARGPVRPPSPAAAPPVADLARRPLDCVVALDRTRALLRESAYVDAHLVAMIARMWCDDVALLEIDAIALVRLDEGGRARALLAGRRSRAPSAELLHAWTYFAEHDDDAFDRALALLPAGDAARLRVRAAVGDADAFAVAAAELSRAQAGRVLALERERERAYRRRPWLAGTLSALLPGAGQLYAGSFESAAIAFVLNGVAIASTAELVRDERYLTAGLIGLGASVFYVGNVVSAVDLARLRNDRAQQPWTDALERELLPELAP